MAKFRVGDIVRVRKDLIVNRRYGDWDFVLIMKKFLGRCVTISGVFSNYYTICDDNVGCGSFGLVWTDAMFENDVISRKKRLRRDCKREICGGVQDEE